MLLFEEVIELETLNELKFHLPVINSLLFLIANWSASIPFKNCAFKFSISFCVFIINGGFSSKLSSYVVLIVICPLTVNSFSVNDSWFISK